MKGKVTLLLISTYRYIVSLAFTRLWLFGRLHKAYARMRKFPSFPPSLFFPFSFIQSEMSFFFFSVLNDVTSKIDDLTKGDLLVREGGTKLFFSLLRGRKAGRRGKWETNITGNSRQISLCRVMTRGLQIKPKCLAHLLRSAASCLSFHRCTVELWFSLSRRKK